jgi:hypothetical protein
VLPAAGGARGAGLAWINTKRANVQLHAGRLEPSVTLPRGAVEVPQSARPRLIATFNSGFKLADSRGGFAVGGRTYARLQNGQATLVGYTDGRVDVLDWRYGSTIPAGVSYARQNLPLLVDEGRLSPNLANDSEWGATVGNAVLVWRSGIGVDRHGNLIYAAGEDQTPGAGQPKNLLPGMSRSVTRYLEPDDRDFFTIYSR